MLSLYLPLTGLLEEELHDLLSLYQVLGNSKYTYQDVKNIQLSVETMMPQAVLARLLRGLKGFLGPTGGDHRYLCLYCFEIFYSLGVRIMVRAELTI